MSARCSRVGGGCSFLHFWLRFLLTTGGGGGGSLSLCSRVVPASNSPPRFGILEVGRRRAVSSEVSCQSRTVTLQRLFGSRSSSSNHWCSASESGATSWWTRSSDPGVLGGRDLRRGSGCIVTWPPIKRPPGADIVFLFWRKRVVAARDRPAASSKCPPTTLCGTADGAPQLAEHGARS